MVKPSRLRNVESSTEKTETTLEVVGCMGRAARPPRSAARRRGGSARAQACWSTGRLDAPGLTATPDGETSAGPRRLRIASAAIDRRAERRTPGGGAARGGEKRITLGVLRDENRDGYKY
eukprot:scaffold126937_cov28-Tisochrysis_lutea.AAC.3